MKKILVVRYAPRDEDPSICSKDIALLGQKIREELGGWYEDYATQTIQSKTLQKIAREIAQAAGVKLGKKITNIMTHEQIGDGWVIITRENADYLYGCHTTKNLSAFLVQIGEAGGCTPTLFFEGGE